MDYPSQIADLVKKATEYDDFNAQRELGLMYDFGNGIVQKDYKEAFYWYRKGAMSDPECSWRLAYFYHHGQGTEQDEQSALYWYRYSLDHYRKISKEAEDYVRYAVAELENKLNEKYNQLSVKAQAGDARSQYLLAMMYVRHVIVPLDFSKIRYWMTKAADGGDMYAQNWLAEAYGLNTYGFERADDKRFHYARCAALQGHTEGAYQLALCYQNGVGVGENDGEAFRWMKIAADKGYEMAMSSVGQYFKDGKGTATNYDSAVRYLKLYCQRDKVYPHGYEHYLIGYCYYYGGYGLKKDAVEALKWLTLAATPGKTDGIEEAVALLGDAYLTGTGVAKNTAKAVEYLEKAAKGFFGSCFAAYKMAYLHFKGLYVEKNYAEASKYIRLADKLYKNNNPELRSQIDLLKKQLFKKGY